MMNASIIRSLIRRRPSASAAAATMFHRRLMGSLTTRDHEEAKLTERMFDAKVMYATYFVLEGFKAAEIKSLFPLMQLYFKVDLANETLVKHLTSPEIKPSLPKGFRVSCKVEVALDGFDDSEVETLRPVVEQYTTAARIDLVEGPNIQLLLARHTEEIEDEAQLRAVCYSEAVLKDSVLKTPGPCIAPVASST